MLCLCGVFPPAQPILQPPGVAILLLWGGFYSSYFVETTSASLFSQCFGCFTAFWAYGCFRFGATTSIGFATSFLRFATLIFGGYCFELFCICSYVRGVATAPHFVYLWPHFSSYQNYEKLACSYAWCACLHMLRVHLHTLWPI